MENLTNSICEALICGDWRYIEVENLHGNNSVIRRCPECHASIKLMKEGKNGQKAHFEHDKRNPLCSLGDAKGKNISYSHISVKVQQQDCDASYQYETLLPLCLARSNVINDSDLAEDLSEVMVKPLSDSEKVSEIQARVGQGKFRQDVIKVWGSETCAVTMMPIKEMLVASHIKAWRNCETTNERLDGANGILLCAHIDRLFDQHLVTFKKVGNEYCLKLSNLLDKSLMKQLGVNEGDALAIGKLEPHDKERFEIYIGYHQKLFDFFNR